MRSDEEKIVRIHFAALIKPEAAEAYSRMINLSSATQDVSVRPSRSASRTGSLGHRRCWIINRARSARRRRPSFDNRLRSTTVSRQTVVCCCWCCW